MPNEGIDNLLHKYSSGRRTTADTNFRSSTTNNNSMSSLGNNSKSYLRSNTDPFAADKYAPSKSSSRRGVGTGSSAKKERRRSSRASRTSSSRRSTHHNNHRSSSSISMDQELIDFTSNSNDSHSQSVFASTTINSTASSSPNNRASVSPSYYHDNTNNDHHSSSSALAFADHKYVRSPPLPVEAAADDDYDGEEEHNALLSLDTPSRNADPHDPLYTMKAFKDDEVFEDELLDEIEMQSPHGPKFIINLNDWQHQADQKKALQKRRRRMGCCVGGCLLLLLVVGGIVAGVVLGTGTQPSTTTATHSATGRQQAVPTASSLLTLWCAEGYDLGPGQTEVSTAIPEDCERACLQGECCWNPHSVYDCTPETQQECAAYESPCRIMVNHQNNDNNNDNNKNDDNDNTLLQVPQALAMLKTSCFTVSPEDPPTEACTQQCHLADCCWNTTSTAQCSEESKQQNCQPYLDYCSFLNDVENQDHSKNTATTEPPAASSSNTLPFPEAPSGLDVYCDPGEMEEISLHICQEKCEPAKCCWGIEAELCPPNVGGEVCQPYAKACSILNELQTYPGNNDSGGSSINSNNIEGGNSGSVNLGVVGGEIPVAPTNLEQRCNHDNIAGSENGGSLLIECERDCLAAACCWHPDMESCSSNERCSAYQQPCSMFVGLFDSGSANSVAAVPTAPSTLSTVCSPDVLTPTVNDGKFIVECEKECLAASCCWKENAAHSCPDAAECADYMEPCGNNLVAALHHLESGNTITQPAASSSSSPSSTTSGSDSEEAKAIHSACNDQVTFFLKTKCEDVCLPGACCYDDAATCDVGIECDIYAPCYVLHNRRQLRH